MVWYEIVVNQFSTFVLPQKLISPLLICQPLLVVPYSSQFFYVHYFFFIRHSYYHFISLLLFKFALKSFDPHQIHSVLFDLTSSNLIISIILRISQISNCNYFHANYEKSSTKRFKKTWYACFLIYQFSVFSRKQASIYHKNISYKKFNCNQIDEFIWL